MIRSFKDKQPRVASTAYIEESAQVIGDVQIGEHSSIWFNAVVRGDVNAIRIGDHTNIQDCSVLHVTAEIAPLIIGDRVTVGHNVVAHGCTVQDGALIGMGAILLDGAVVGEDAFVAAGSVVGMRQKVPPRTLVAGVPAKVKRELTADDLVWLEMSWRHYVELVHEYRGAPKEPGSR